MQLQVDLRRRAFDRERSDAEPRYLELGGGRRLQREHDLEQGIPTRVSHDVELGDEPLEGHVLVLERPQRRLPHPAHQPPKRRIPRHVHPHHQRVHEEADQPLQLRARPPRHRRPHHHVHLTAPARQQPCESRQQHHERGCPLAARELPHALHHRRRDRQRCRRAGIGRDARPRMVERELERRRVGELPAPVAELPVEELPAQRLPLRGRELAVGELERRQARRRALDERGIEPTDLVE